MIKEIVEFSKELGNNKIYEAIQKDSRKIDKPIMVVPVNDDLTGFLVDEIHFVFKNIDEELIPEKDGNSEIKKYCVLDGKLGKDNTILVNQQVNEEKNCFQGLEAQPEKWRNILKSLALYTKKPSNDAKGGKSIGSNKGTNSYNILIFEGKFKSGSLKKKKVGEVFTGDLFFCEKGFCQKIKDTYRIENIHKGIPEDIKDDNKKQFKELLLEFSTEEIIQAMWARIEVLKELLTIQDEKCVSKLAVENMFVIIKLPENNYTDTNIYDDWYNKYLQKKIFRTEPKKFTKGICSSCGEEKNLWVSNTFNDMDTGKPYLMHQHRFSTHKVDICEDCSLHLYKFQEFFLNKLRITLFPLFIDNAYREHVISLLKESEKIGKVAFSEIMKQVYSKTNQDELDFYLIMYNQMDNILSFDYITGYTYKIHSYSIFQIELIFDQYFFGYNLKKNYFSAKVDTKRADINNLVYRYRQPFFDFFYRAKYTCINTSVIDEVYINVLKTQLKLLLSNDEESYLVKFVISALEKNLELNLIFGGNRMETINRVKESGKIADKESFAYFAGQITYYLLNQSKTENKTHTLVEPFMNMTNFKILADKVEELFKKYKHALPMNLKRFNEKFSEFWAFLYDNKDEKFTQDLKILFYAGYFNSNDNYFYKKQEA